MKFYKVFALVMVIFLPTLANAKLSDECKKIKIEIKELKNSKKLSKGTSGSSIY